MCAWYFGVPEHKARRIFASREWPLVPVSLYVEALVGIAIHVNTCGVVTSSGDKFDTKLALQESYSTCPYLEYVSVLSGKRIYLRTRWIDLWLPGCVVLGVQRYSLCVQRCILLDGRRIYLPTQWIYLQLQGCVFLSVQR